MQVHARVCQKNKLEELGKKPCLLNQFCGWRSKFKGSYKKSGKTYQDDILKDDSP